MINVMQLLLATPLINLTFGPNVYEFSDSLLKVMNFDFYDSDVVNLYLFGEEINNEALLVDEEDEEEYEGRLLARNLAKKKSSSKRS